MSKHDPLPENSRSGNQSQQQNMEGNTSTNARSSTTNHNKTHSAAIKGFNFTRRPWPHPVPDRHFHHSPSYNNHSPTKVARFMKHSHSEQKGSVTKISTVPCSPKPSPKKTEEVAVVPQNGPSTKQTQSTTEKTLQQLANFTRNSHRNSVFTPIICSTSPTKPHTDNSEPSLVVTPRFVPALQKTAKHKDSSVDRTESQDGSISTIVEVIDQSNKDMQPKSSSSLGNDSTMDHGATTPAHSQLSMEHMVPFVQGSVIQLGSGNLKCVEDISTTDLVQSAELSDNISTESCTVSKISKKSDENIILDLIVESTKEQIQIESSFEHPFFVMNNGWASCNPDKTMVMYNLQCKALLVGDVCLFLVPEDDKDADKTSMKKPKTTSELIKSGKKTSFIKKGFDKKDAAEDAPRETTHKKLNKTSEGSKRKRRWSMSDVSDLSANCEKQQLDS